MSTATTGVRAFGPISKKSQAIGVLGIALILMFAIYVAVLDDSPILPGNWAPYGPLMLFYIVLLMAAVLLMGFRQDLLLASPGSTVSGFVLRLSGMAAATWMVLSVAFLSSSGIETLTGTEKLQVLVFNGFFVAVAEETLFRQVLPKLLNSWVLGSVVIFAGMHVPAYFLETGATFGTAFFSSLIQVAIMGVVLWLVYAPRKDGGILGLGPAGSIGVHFTYNVFVAGAIAGLPLALAGAGLTPL